MASPFQEHLDFVLQDLRWTEWSPLPLARRTPERYRAGIYEVRQAQGEVVYVGQTGDFFTTRMGALGGIFQEVMPFNDPHTAGPCLWALRRSGAEFEARFSPTGNLSEQERRALETVELARLRRAMVWPIANYGGMPMGWVKSSNRRQARRGGPGSNEGVEKGPPWVPSELRGDPMSLGFGERDWSEWQPLTRGAGVGSPGIYRLAGTTGSVVYLGQAGTIVDRLRQHLQSLSSQEGKYAVLRSQVPLTVSWTVLTGSTSRERLMIEDDLVACAITSDSRVPVAQYLDRGRREG
jgi:hypothetical protein